MQVPILPPRRAPYLISGNRGYMRPSFTNLLALAQTKEQVEKVIKGIEAAEWVSRKTLNRFKKRCAARLDEIERREIRANILR